jgi:hypothetical protein
LERGERSGWERQRTYGSGRVAGTQDGLEVVRDDETASLLGAQVESVLSVVTPICASERRAKVSATA